VKRGIRARAFHAKLSDERRYALLAMWKDGAIECIVATIAFGMVSFGLWPSTGYLEPHSFVQGVDQAHVRYVVHYDMPKTFEGGSHISSCVHS